MQCTAAEDTYKLLNEVNPLAHFNAKWYNNHVEMDITLLPKISNNAGEAFKAPMCDLLKKYPDVREHKMTTFYFVKGFHSMF